MYVYVHRAITRGRYVRMDGEGILILIRKFIQITDFAQSAKLNAHQFSRYTV